MYSYRVTGITYRMKQSVSRRPLYAIVALFGIATCIALALLITVKTNEGARQALLANPLMEHFKHTYNSFKKLPDIFFLPYLFAESSIPTYRISIPIDNIIRMNAVLPAGVPLSGKLAEENKLFVKAEFEDPESGYQARVDIKYRGENANHWNALQKSYRVQFPDGNFLEGQRLVSFVTPYDRFYYIEPLNAYRAKKLGLTNLDMKFVRLVINGADTGVYLMFEHWSPEFLAKKGLPETKIFGLADGDLNRAHSLADYVNMFDKEGDVKKEELATLLELRDKADEATFKKLLPEIFDMDKLYGWNILTILSGSTHQSEDTNPVLYFDGATGKFELVPWDTEVADVSRVPFDDTASLLIRRAMNIPEFRAERDRRLREYIEDPANLTDDLAFYDALAEGTKTDFLKDNSKFHNNFQYLSVVARNRAWVAKAFEEADRVLDPSYAYPPYTPPQGAPAFSGTFGDFSDLALPLDAFLYAHPQFYRIDADTIGIAGSHVFLSDIIIPSGISLSIAPGTTLWLDSDISLIAHGALYAKGTAFAPITIRRLNPSKPWGTIAAIGAEEPSVLSFVHAEGGSGTITNGILVTGMMAFHGNGGTLIDHSVFSESGDDDLVNTKGGVARVVDSEFRNSFSDALDVDYPQAGSLIARNTFTNIGTDGNGDAIDLSFADLEVTGNTVMGCNDKGISVGEASHPKIMGNTFIGCGIGIAVKDLSNAVIAGNTFSENDVAISLYRKKDTFGGSHAVIGENVFTDSETEVKTDALSTVDYRNE